MNGQLKIDNGELKNNCQLCIVNCALEGTD